MGHLSYGTNNNLTKTQKKDIYLEMEPCQDYYYNEEISFASHHVPLSSLFILSSCASTHLLLPICLIYLFHFYFNSLSLIQAKSEYDRVSASKVLKQRAYIFHILLSFLFFTD